MQIKNGLDDCACCSSNGSDTHRRFVKREFEQWGSRIYIVYLGRGNKN